MKVSSIIKRLRESVPFFNNRVDGIAEFSQIDLTRNFPIPCAYVLPESESASETSYVCDYESTIRQEFSVVTYLDPGKLAQGYDVAEVLRKHMVRALAGFIEEDSLLVYEGMDIVEINRARLVVKYGFSCETQIHTEDTALNPHPIPKLNSILVTSNSVEGSCDFSYLVDFKEQ